MPYLSGDEKILSMNGFVISVIVLTVGMILYYVAMVAIEIANTKPHSPVAEEVPNDEDPDDPGPLMVIETSEGITVAQKSHTEPEANTDSDIDEAKPEDPPSEETQEKQNTETGPETEDRPVLNETEDPAPNNIHVKDVNEDCKEMESSDTDVYNIDLFGPAKETNKTDESFSEGSYFSTENVKVATNEPRLQERSSDGDAVNLVNKMLETVGDLRTSPGECRLPELITKIQTESCSIEN